MVHHLGHGLAGASGVAKGRYASYLPFLVFGYSAITQPAHYQEVHEQRSANCRQFGNMFFKNEAEFFSLMSFFTSRNSV